MQAEVIDRQIRFTVAPAEREDGSFGPPLKVVLSLRPCWKRPPQRIELHYVYEDGDVAYYDPL